MTPGVTGARGDPSRQMRASGSLPPAGPVIRAASLRGFEPLVRALGGDPQEYLHRFSISPVTLHTDDALIAITDHDLMLDTVARELACPDFGLRLAESQDATILGPLALAIEASANVEEAVQCASRFLFVHSPALSISVEPDPRGARGIVVVTYRKDLSESPYSPQAIELGMGLLYRIAVSLLGTRQGLQSVQIPHAPLSPVARYLEFFGVDVKFGGTTAALRIPRQILDRPFSSANHAIRQMAWGYLAAQHPDPDHLLSVQVRRAVAGSLGFSAAVPSLSSTARLLGLHPRTLQRRLADEGATHEAILDDVRREAARRWILTTDLPLIQISHLLGFSEQSSLTHAATRWFGVTPRQLRRQRPTDSGVVAREQVRSADRRDP